MSLSIFDEGTGTQASNLCHTTPYSLVNFTIQCIKICLSSFRALVNYVVLLQFFVLGRDRFVSFCYCSRVPVISGLQGISIFPYLVDHCLYFGFTATE